MGINKYNLSGMAASVPIVVGEVASPGTTIHTAPSADNGTDNVWIYAHNTGSATVNLTMQYGTVDAGDGPPSGSNFIMGIPPQAGLTLVSPGLVFESGSIVKAFAAHSGSIFLTGYVNRVT